MDARRLPKSLYSPTYERFLALLKTARDEAGLTQTDVAARLGRPQSFVSKCESGERRIDVAEFLAFCHVYGADPCGIIRTIEQQTARRRRRK